MPHKSYKTDPFVNELIKTFARIDKLIPEFISEERRKNTQAFRRFCRIIDSIQREDAFSSDFKIKAFDELLYVVKSGVYKNKTKSPCRVIDRLIEERGILSPEVHLLIMLPRMLGNKYIDMVAPKGHPPHWLLNILICVLIEYGKHIYPDENHYSVIASKFNSSNFKMTGWKRSTSDRTANKRIFDRYKFMKDNFNISNIYTDVLFAFQP